MTHIDLDELETLAGKATPGPWRYRPSKYDDWGWVRGPNDDAMVAVAARGAWDYDAVADAHRKAGTDPFGHNAAFIASTDPQTVLALIRAVRLAKQFRAECNGPVDETSAECEAEIISKLDAALLPFTREGT